MDKDPRQSPRTVLSHGLVLPYRQALKFHLVQNASVRVRTQLSAWSGVSHRPSLSASSALLRRKSSVIFLVLWSRQ